MLREILRFLNRLPNIVAYRQNVGAAMARNRDGSSRFIRFGKRGLPDIGGYAIQPCQRTVMFRSQMDVCRICNGAGSIPVAIGIEAKKTGGQATPEQVAYLERLKAAGGIALIASSVEQVRAVLAERNLIR